MKIQIPTRTRKTWVENSVHIEQSESANGPANDSLILQINSTGYTRQERRMALEAGEAAVMAAFSAIIESDLKVCSTYDQEWYQALEDECHC